VKKRGFCDVTLKRDSEATQFVEVLKEFHSKRVGKLEELGWVD